MRSVGGLIELIKLHCNIFAHHILPLPRTKSRSGKEASVKCLGSKWGCAVCWWIRPYIPMTKFSVICFHASDIGDPGVLQRAHRPPEILPSRPHESSFSKGALPDD
jgi:hypothetical protein